jgi:predicted lipoprotein with Yx(FWY)xxD motif
MKRRLLTITAVTAALSLTVGLAAASSASVSPSSNPVVAVSSTPLGKVLVDGRGHTLYLFEKDKRGTSACTGQCAAYWPPLIASAKPSARTGVKATLLGTTKRTDGRVQVTYNHHPLYAFTKDTRKGQTSGEEVDAFGAEWYAISAAGAKVEKPSGSAGGYGYGS